MKKISKEEQKSLNYIKDKIKRPKFLNTKDFVPGKMVFFSYNPKDQESPYDKTPLIFVVWATKKHVLGLNLHWAPIDIRRKILKAFIKYNADNIKKNRPLELSKNLASKFWTLARPIFRKYIKSRISRRGAVIEPNEMGNVISLRAEHFIGIDSNSAWKMAINSMKRKN